VVPTVVPLTAVAVAFYAVFGVFVVAFVVLVVVTMRWAVQRDRAGRAEWVRRQRPGQQGPPPVAPPQTNGRAPGRRGQRGSDPRRPG
jgi:hypothetical protein